MDVTDAVERIGAIHAYLARAEEYRGYHPAALAASGLLGLLSALAQPWMVDATDPSAFVRYWVAVGLVCGCLAGAATVTRYLRQEDEFARRRTRTVLCQFIPCLLAGLAVTAVLARPEHVDRAVAFLPGLWALLYGLGTVATLPYLPRLAGAVGVWYLVAGGLLLHLVEGPVPSGWSVGLPFGVGQLLAATVLYCTQREEIEP